MVTPRLTDGEPGPDDPEPPLTPDAPGDPGGEDPAPPESDPEDPPALSAQAVPTAAHAIILGSRDAAAIDLTGFLILDDGDAVFAPHPYKLQSQDLGNRLNGLDLEREIVNAPQTLAFRVVRTGAGEPELESHPYLSNLDLSALPSGPFRAFEAARSALFGSLASDKQRCSVHAIAAGECVDEAVQYVETYQRLIAAIASQPRFRAEFEAVLLTDTVFDSETGTWWIAPTAPLTVSYLLQLAGQARAWSADAAALLDDDLRTCTPRHLLPNFYSEGTWYQTAESPAFLWRRYESASSSDPAESRPRYIAKRIRRFLDVHPAYRDRRQELAIAFVEPGDGHGPLEALRLLMKPLTRPGAGATLPRFIVTIVSSSDRPTALEEVLRGSGSLASEIDRALRDRVKLRRVHSSEDLVDHFQHITFVFQSSLQEEPGAVELDSRATTLFVGGLAPLPGRSAEVDRNETAFHWGTFAGPHSENPLGDIARSGLELVGGMPRAPLAAGRTRMPTARVGLRFLEPLYASSAWVVHLDRLLGLEAFAPDATGSQARYLIDFEERSDPGQPGLDAITATSRINPYRLALRQALNGYGAPEEEALDRILQLFNGVSGRWALDLVGATGHDLQEKVGLAAALEAVRDLDGWLTEEGAAGVIIPLDELIESLPSGARPRDGQRCDDLLYLRLPLNAPADAPQPLYARLLEVKYRKDDDAAAAESARRQLERSYEWLRRVFDTSGPGRAFRARDLAELLRGAVTRARSFGLLQLDAQADVEAALGRIISGAYTFELGYQVGGRRIHGDFVSIESSSTSAVHRQDLPGSGLDLGHVRLGRSVIDSLAKGEAIAKPPSWAVPEFGPAPPPEEPPTTDGGERPPAASPPPGSGGRGHSQVSASMGRPPHSTPAELGLVAHRLDTAFAKYGLAVEPFTPELAQVGPSVIRFRTRTLGRLSITEVERRARDIGREIASPGEVHVADEPGFVTIDVPRAERDALVLADVLPSLDAAPTRPGSLDFVVGVAPSGEARIADLSRLPHLLVAGATGSGKSVFLRGLLTELLRARTPDQLHLLIIDPKRLDFVAFTKAPHLRGATIISDPQHAVETLQATLDAEIDMRQPLLEAAGVSSASEFYEAGGRLEDLPQLVILVDEFADLVLAGPDPRAFLDLIQRYAQLTRAYGIYLVLATQRPSVNVVTGSIKANLAARIAFSLPSVRDSMTVIDQGGAEDLLGDGDLLFYRSGRVERLQAPFTSLQDVRQVLL
ncbi:FtsK/SpoIIIE domain-containing protein [Microbacterium sp. JZ31]|uniref:FtsK/SpoIIIE domain-containing protein n=1 Tax=Microbacterium sp. JZ31 TaxID=1906274 RepID=UPI001932932A|nr:FtsK/SpoIIIE domain-containing protein [Microbacterium sp. JZ31]